MRDVSPTKRAQAPSAAQRLRPPEERHGLREPIYLASQLASICDVDLKTIHNWCDRHNDPEVPAELESFRTPGNHLRFRHSSVLRFLVRWGYPIPDALLRDRPHVLVVEPDKSARDRMVALLGLVRPGMEEPTDPRELPPTVSQEIPREVLAALPTPPIDLTPRPPLPDGRGGASHGNPMPSPPSPARERGVGGVRSDVEQRDVEYPDAPGESVAPAESVAEATPEGTDTVSAPEVSTLGLWATSRYYVHLWHDPYLALLAIGERTGAGAPPDLAVLTVPTPGIDARAWLRAATAEGDGHELRFILVAPDERVVTAATAPGVVSVVPRAEESSLRVILDQQALLLMGRVADRAAPRSVPGQRKRRIPIAPREPIFVASQVANIWDVDLKTVHNWVERGDIEAFRTPGRHLRFRRRSLLHFLRRYNMAIPEDLVPERPRVMIIDPDGRCAKRLAQSMTPLFDVILQPDPVAALVDIGGMCAGAGLIDAVVASLPVEGVDDRAWLAALAEHPDTRYTRVVVISGDDGRHREWQSLGVIATVQRHGIDQVATVLERALGLTH